MRKKFVIFFCLIFILITTGLSCLAIKYKDAVLFYTEAEKPKTIFYAKDFGFEDIKSNTDFDNDGIDDYSDIVEGAKIEAKNKPQYKDGYYQGDG